MDKNWNNESNQNENISNMGFESLSLGQKLLSKCLKKTGISVSVRGIAVNTTSQIKTAGSAWKSEAKYDPSVESKTGTLDDLSFPDLLGSSNRDVSVNNRQSEVSSVTNDNDRLSKDSRRTRYKIKHRLASVQSVNSHGYHLNRDGSFGNSFSFKDSNFDQEDDILGSDFLMPGMKGNYPLGFTNFIGKGVQSPPPPPPPLPYTNNSQSIYQSFQQYGITRLKNTRQPKQNPRQQSPTVSDSNWLDNKSEGYNDAELTTAIDSLNHSILADKPSEEPLTIKSFNSDKLSQNFMDLSNFDNSLLLQDSMNNQLDERLVDQLENSLSNQLENTLTNQLDTSVNETSGTNTQAQPEKRKKERFIRRKKFTDNTISGHSPAQAPTSGNSKTKEKKGTNLVKEEYQYKTSPENTTPAPQELSQNRDNTNMTSPKLPESNTSQSSKPEKEPSKHRRPRHRTRSHKKEPEDDNWRNSGSSVDSKVTDLKLNESKQNDFKTRETKNNENGPNENAANIEKTSERRHFKQRNRNRHQPSTATTAATDIN